MTGEMVGHRALRPGDVIVVQDVPVTILDHGERSTETVFPLAGRECWRYWARREDTGDEGWMTYGAGATVERRQMAPTALVRCGSHRARERMMRLMPDERDAVAYHSFRRETGKGVYRIPADLADEAKSITGVTGFRDGSDLHPCWPKIDREDQV